MKHKETIKVNGIEELVRILDKEGVSVAPVHVGFGLEVYASKTTQVTYDCRNNDNIVTIRRGV